MGVVPANKELVDYFIRETNRKFEEGTARFDIIDKKLDLLFAFKWQIIGGSLVLSSLLSVVISGIVTIVVKSLG